MKINQCVAHEKREWNFTSTIADSLIENLALK